MGTFKDMINTITSKVPEATMDSEYAPRITQIVEKYLGRGKKVGDMSREQTEALSLIIGDLEELYKKVI